MALSDVINAIDTSASTMVAQNAQITSIINTLSEVRVAAQGVQTSMTIDTAYAARQEEANALKAEAADLEAKCDVAIAALKE